MSNEDCKKFYGSEYPAAVEMDGIRAPLRSETRFTRDYHSDEHKTGTMVSRLADGSTSITISELEREWETWSDCERTDFCFACVDMSTEPELPEMIRFMARHAAPKNWHGLLSYLVALVLPGGEACAILLQALSHTDPGGAATVLQGIAMTEYPDASVPLRKYLEVVWAHNALWDDAQLVNWVAFEATACIAYLIDLGATPVEFEGRV